ncbi:MAG TPA: T9SS type A sorting domain-containing protein, partial [Chitinophagaceae bacterium]|nr:T9SS type A sorting domain-containing protein [Chitinophagaceae bacterium]
SSTPDLQDNLLIKNYPNPFTGSTTITFKTEGGHTSVMIIDTLGRMISTPVDQEYTAPGQYSVTFNAERLAAGVYYARLQNGALQQVRSMLKVK